MTDLVEDETWIQRWEHWVCARSKVAAHFDQHWEREPIPGKVWRSGNQAFWYVRRSLPTAPCALGASSAIGAQDALLTMLDRSS